MNIFINGRDNTGKAFSTAGNSVQRFKSKVDQANFGLSKSAKNMFAAVAVAGQLELAFGAVTTVTAAINGDMEAVEKSIKNLPMGIGPAVRSFETMLGAITGINAELAELNAQKGFADGITKANDAILKTVGDSKKYTEELKSQLQLQNAPDQFAKQKILLERQFHKDLEKTRELMATSGAGSVKRLGEQQMLLRETYLAKVAELDKKAAKQQKGALGSQAKAAVEQTRKELGVTRTLERMDSQIKQAQLKLQGDHLGASLEQLRQNYAERIQLAKDAGNAELAERLKTLQALGMSQLQKDAEVKNKGTGGKPGGGPAPRLAAGESRFMTGVVAAYRDKHDPASRDLGPGALGNVSQRGPVRSEKQDRLAKAVADQTKVAKESKVIFKSILAALQRDTPAPVVMEI
ncbi:MAG: hypothetical protein GY842_13875 [bacterium]|nr:hypothetical protein [bacterium]